jgi:hypothetical protein
MRKFRGLEVVGVRCGLQTRENNKEGNQLDAIITVY